MRNLVLSKIQIILGVLFSYGINAYPLHTFAGSRSTPTHPMTADKGAHHKPTSDEIIQWIAELGNNKFKVREAAQRKLETHGNEAFEKIAEALKVTKDE